MCFTISILQQAGRDYSDHWSTGSGKSTLVNLIPRFYDVTEGSITLDGVDVREVSQHMLRDKIGYVPQKGVLFSGDIASNILFGNPDGGEAVMKEAAQIAQAEEFIEANRRNITVTLHRRFQRIWRTETEIVHCKSDCETSRAVYL